MSVYKCGYLLYMRYTCVHKFVCMNLTSVNYFRSQLKILGLKRKCNGKGMSLAPYGGKKP